MGGTSGTSGSSGYSTRSLYWRAIVLTLDILLTPAAADMRFCLAARSSCPTLRTGVLARRRPVDLVIVARGGRLAATESRCSEATAMPMSAGSSANSGGGGGGGRGGAARTGAGTGGGACIGTGGGGGKKKAPRRAAAASKSQGATTDSLTAPMQGTIVKVAVEDGTTVSEGDLMVVIEAMKMEQPIMAHKAGVVSSLNAAIGETVTSGAVLAIIKDADGGSLDEPSEFGKDDFENSFVSGPEVP